MKPRARLGMALLLLGGCNTANNLPDVQLPDFFPKANPTAQRSPAPAPAGTPGTPAYVMPASPNGDNSQAVVQLHMTLPIKMETQPVQTATKSSQGPFGPVMDVPPSEVATANQPGLSVLNSTAKQPPAPVQQTAAMNPPPPTPPEGSTPILASIQDPPAGESIDKDMNSTKPDSRPALSDVLGKTSRSPEPRPVGHDVAMAPQKPATGAALSGIVEDETPAALPTPATPPVSSTPPVSHLFAEPAPPPPAWPTATDVHSAPPQATTGPEIRLVNSKRISLNYEVKDGGAAGPTEVELWYTRDGRNWKKKETLPQGKPPCVVDVEDEDLYGFTLLVHRGGSPEKAPQEGDRPQVWVEVDVTKPTVWLLGVEAGKGAEGRQVTILWKASDKNISSRPITLSYGPGPEGPWLPFASQLENTGHYLWQIPRDVPTHFLLRVEAIDQAGNIGMAQTPQALGEEPAQPTAAILKVEGTQK